MLHVGNCSDVRNIPRCDYFRRDVSTSLGVSLQYATSVMVCGGYEDDADDGEELIYTGMSL